jgi:AcrR family transcriptional regulator
MRMKDEDKVPRIYNAAIRIINRNGFEGCSMSKIAREADIAPATIYLYFDNKEDMLKKLFVHVKQGLGGSYFHNIEELKADKTTFRAIWYNYYQYVIDYIDEYIFLENFSNSPQLMQIERIHRLDYCPTFESLLERSKTEGLVLKLNNDIIFSMLFAPMSYLVKKYLSENKRLTESELQQIFETSWKGISV